METYKDPPEGLSHKDKVINAIERVKKLLVENADKMKKENVKAVTEVEEALNKFCCYLYLGTDRLVYECRPWNDDDHYAQGERMRNLEILAADKKSELVPIDKIKLAMSSNLIRRPETLMFALAMCARQKKSEKLRAAAYYFLAEHCKEWKYFILFIKYASYLCRVEGSKDKVEENGDKKKPIGWGHGWKNAVNKWYLTKSPTDLATLVVKHKGDHGWTHRDIFKLSHPETCGLEVEKQAILCYVMKGLEAAEKKFNDDLEAKKILEHIRVTEEFKRCCNKQRVIELMAIHKYPIEYVHPKLQKDKDVRVIALEQMDVRKILNDLPKLREWGLLTDEEPATPTVERSLVDPANIIWNKLLPLDILLVRKRYLSLMSKKVKTRPKQPMRTIVVNSKLKNKSKNFKPHNKSFRTAERIDDALDKALHISQSVLSHDRIDDALDKALHISRLVNITDDSKKRYLFSIKVAPQKHKCHEVGLALALPLLSRADLPEDAVKIIAYDNWMGGGLPFPITPDTTLDKASQRFYRLKMDNHPFVVFPFGIFVWAYNKPYDVVINVTNDKPKKLEHVAMKLCKQRNPQIKCINVMINKVPFTSKEDDWKDSLIINGCDEHVPWIIEAYVRGYF